MTVATRALSLDWIGLLANQSTTMTRESRLPTTIRDPPHRPTPPFSRHSFAKQLQQACMHACIRKTCRPLQKFGWDSMESNSIQGHYTSLRYACMPSMYRLGAASKYALGMCAHRLNASHPILRPRFGFAVKTFIQPFAYPCCIIA